MGHNQHLYPVEVSSPSLAELRVFDCVVRRGSFSAAARELGLSQQAVSARLRGFERLIEIELLLRSPAGVVLTESGEAVIAWAREVLEASTRLDEAIAGLRGQSVAQTLMIAASQTIAGHRLPGWLLRSRSEQLAAGQAAAVVALRTGNSEEVATLVRDGVADIGFIESPTLPVDLASQMVQEDHMVLAVPPEHPWADRKSIPLEEVSRIGLVTREEGSGTRAAFEHSARTLGFTLGDPAVTLSTEAAVRSAVIQGVAPAVLSELTVQDDLRLNRMRVIPIDPPITRPFTAIWRGSQRDLTGFNRRMVSIASQITPASIEE